MWRRKCIWQMFVCVIPRPYVRGWSAADNLQVTLKPRKLVHLDFAVAQAPAEVVELHIRVIGKERHWDGAVREAL